MHWYVMHSKTNKEEFLYEQLRSQDIDAYYPFIRVNPVNPRAKKTKPYFPGYLFIRVDLEKIGTSMLKWAPGSIGLVRFGGEYARVPDFVIEEIRRNLEIINANGNKKPQRFKSGDVVEIRSKPFDKYQAIFDSHIPGRERVRVLLQLLNDRQISVELSPEEIELKN